MFEFDAFLNQLSHIYRQDDSASGGIRIVINDAPPTGKAIEVANGVWWTRLPLSQHGNHVNVYVLQDGDSWTLVDTGTNSSLCRDALNAVFSSEPFNARPLTRLIVTHYHHDHIGLAGEFYSRGVSLWTSRLTWLFARMLQMDQRDIPYPEQIRFAERAGLKGPPLAAYARRPPTDYPNNVCPIPYVYHRIRQGDIIKIGSRHWKAIMGDGHAAEHVTLWSDDGLAITGDQILPGIAASLSVRGSEPESDHVTEWVISCQNFIDFGDDQTICLPGHNQPFCGAVTRCHQLIASQEATLIRLLEHLSRPRTALDCLAAVYRRQLQNHEVPTMLTETVGFLNHVYARGFVRRTLASDGSFLWQRIKPLESITGKIFNGQEGTNRPNVRPK